MGPTKRLKIRNEHNGSQAQDPTQMQEPDAPAFDESRFDYFPLEIPEVFPGKKWDPRWLTLVCHYLGSIRWPQCPASGPPISLMEMMVDLFVTFQVTAPVNKKNLRKKQEHCSHITWDQIKFTNHLLSKEESSLWPPPLLTECHSMWMHTLQHVSPFG